MNKTFRKTAAAAALAAMSLVAAAQTVAPLPAVNPYRHSNLAEAQRDVMQAYNAVVAAQQANSYLLGGHGDRARTLLLQANQELVAAARVSNLEGH